jgi:hypothetical protein
LFSLIIGVDGFSLKFGSRDAEFVNETFIEGWGETQHVEDLVEHHFGVADEIGVFGLDVS